ncbi:MAG TPA: glutathione S-transferase [Ramlibacter sp.]|nr:glutathione S-transferase [Ramlibacter sp.]
MIVVHHLNNSRSQRVLWLLEELGLDYELRLYQRDKQTMLAPPELKAVHPLGKSPVISDGDLVLAESGAILEYLVDRYGKGRWEPERGSPAHLRYRYWMHYAEGSLMPPLLMKLVFDSIQRAKMPFFIKPVAAGICDRARKGFVMPQVNRHLDFVEAELGKSTWFAGEDFTAADVQMSFPIEAAQVRGGLNESRPRLMSFLQRIRARPAYQRAVEKGGAYKLMG